MAKKRSRRNISEKFVKLERRELTSSAYAALDSVARDLYVGFKYRYNGQNNGYIPFSVREAAQWLGCAQNTARRAITDLQAKGFIQCMRESAFNVKDRTAREWRLTCFTCDRTGWPATREFTRWEPGVDFRTRYQQLIRTVSNTDTVPTASRP